VFPELITIGIYIIGESQVIFAAPSTAWMTPTVREPAGGPIDSGGVRDGGVCGIK